MNCPFFQLGAIWDRLQAEPAMKSTRWTYRPTRTRYSTDAQHQRRLSADPLGWSQQTQYTRPHALVPAGRILNLPTLRLHTVWMIQTYFYWPATASLSSSRRRPQPVPLSPPFNFFYSTATMTNTRHGEMSSIKTDIYHHHDHRRNNHRGTISHYLTCFYCSYFPVEQKAAVSSSITFSVKKTINLQLS